MEARVHRTETHLPGAAEGLECDGPGSLRTLVAGFPGTGGAPVTRGVPLLSGQSPGGRPCHRPSGLVRDNPSARDDGDAYSQQGFPAHGFLMLGVKTHAVQLNTGSSPTASPVHTPRKQLPLLAPRCRARRARPRALEAGSVGPVAAKIHVSF